MEDWGKATGDQFLVDTESRYPLFSDIYTSDASIVTPGAQLHRARSYEGTLRHEQYGYPVQYNKRGVIHGAEQRPMRRRTVEERENDLLLEQLRMHEIAVRRALAEDAERRAKDAEKAKKCADAAKNQQSMSDQNQMMMVLVFLFIFVVLVIVCACLSASLSDVKAQLSAMREYLKK